jgi:hypothetical protein
MSAEGCLLKRTTTAITRREDKARARREVGAPNQWALVGGELKPNMCRTRRSRKAPKKKRVKSASSDDDVAKGEPVTAAESNPPMPPTINMMTGKPETPLGAKWGEKKAAQEATVGKSNQARLAGSFDVTLQCDPEVMAGLQRTKAVEGYKEELQHPKR